MKTDGAIHYIAQHFQAHGVSFAGQGFGLILDGFLQIRYIL